ncbi:MAG: hypothetical protein D3908_07010, partial [Candidatus Electrothrix sp. AUS4]|nr:hypothetical protein [Candidatus Electrothrix sp. AUS4]
FPVTDQRPIFHLAMSITAGFAYFKFRESEKAASKNTVTRFLFLSLLLMSLAVVNYHASGRATVVKLTMLNAGLFFISLYYFGRNFRLITILFLIGVGMVIPFEEKESITWRCSFSFPAGKKLYGSEFVSVPAGERPEKKMLRRPRRFIVGNLAPHPPTVRRILPRAYTTAVFNGTYGLYGQSNLKRSKLYQQRWRILNTAYLIESQFELFSLQPGVVLIGKPNDDIIELIKNFKVEHCNAEGLCFDEKQQNHGITLEWKGFSAEQIRFSIQHNENKERLIVLNENAYPGWHVSILREGTRQDIPLVKNDLGLIAFRLPPGDSLVELRYHRSIYMWSNIVALGGIVLVALLIFIVSMPLQRFKSKKDESVLKLISV